MKHTRTTYHGLKIDLIYDEFEKNCERYPKSRVKLVPIRCAFEDYNGVD